MKKENLNLGIPESVRSLKDELVRTIGNISASEAGQSEIQLLIDLNTLWKSLLLFSTKCEHYAHQQAFSLLEIHEDENVQLFSEINGAWQVYLPWQMMCRAKLAPSTITNVNNEIAHIKLRGMVSKQWENSSAELLDICQALMEQLLKDLLRLAKIGTRLESETKQMVENQYDMFMKKNLIVSTNFKKEMLGKLGGKAIDAVFCHEQIELVYGVLSPELQRKAKDYKGNLLLLVQGMQGENTDKELEQIFMVYLKEEVLTALLNGKKDVYTDDEKFIKTMNDILRLYPDMFKYTFIAIYQKMNALKLTPKRTLSEYRDLLLCCEIPADKFPGKTSLKTLCLKNFDGTELVVFGMSAKKQKGLNEICNIFVTRYKSL